MRRSRACWVGGWLAVAACGGDPPPLDPEAVVVPAELGDDTALAELASWAGLPTVRGLPLATSSSFDRGRGKAPITALTTHGNRDMNNFDCRSADAEVDAPELVEVVTDLPSCPEPDVRGLVMARFTGPGRLRRLWLTSFHLESGPADRDLLRLYRDDERDPVVQVPLAAAIDGSASPMFAPPFGLGGGRELAWHYPVAFRAKLLVVIDRVGALDFVYHQSTTVRDPAAVGPSPDVVAARADAAGLLTSVASGPPAGPALAAPVAIDLAAGQTLTLLDLAGPATIDALALSVPEARLPELADVTLEIAWDGGPSFSLPAPALFGAALSPPTRPSLALASEIDGAERVLTLRLPMPFASRARIRATASAALAAPLPLTLAARGRRALPAAPWGHLVAEAHETDAPATGEHPIAMVAGRGRYVGTCVALEGHALDDAVVGAPLNFLEGDERFTVDGAVVERGTGTEDYFDSAFYFADGERGTAFAQAWDVATDPTTTPASGRASACRWHVLGEEIEFTRGLEASLEIGPARPDLLDRYRSTAYYYLVP